MVVGSGVSSHQHEIADVHASKIQMVATDRIVHYGVASVGK